MGATYLRAHYYDTLHLEGAGTGLSPYCTKTLLPSHIRDELLSWQFLLRSPFGRFSRMRHSATLCPNWGDGSGTGGTLSLPDQPLRMWQGQWDPIVYCFSYWKELKTLLLTMAMELIKLKGGADGCGTTVFYFTDKSTTYWIAQAGHSSSPCLHRLIWQIQCLELEFGIHL